MINIYHEITRLINYSIRKEFITEFDISFARNILMSYFKLVDFKSDNFSEDNSDLLSDILDRMLDYAYQNNIILENDLTSRDLADTQIISLLLPFPSQILFKFEKIKSDFSLKAATDYFYNFSIDCNYIRMDRINKNIVWQTNTEYGDLQITINLSKPEKDPKAIAAARKIPSSGYPKCLLCAENVGFAGNLNHPARQNLRVLPLLLNNEKWCFQYSPFVYYNEHCIVFKEQHDPMKLSVETFIRLLDFTDAFPHYFIGSNADLPIVGGSILNHDHFQGGNHEFPMALAESEEKFTHSDFAGVDAEIVKWPMSVIRLKSADKKQLISTADYIYKNWQNYSDPGSGIFAITLEGEEDILHNTITPIARKRNGLYEIDIVLRNNLTSDEHPFGIYHPHQELHHIKKENIGLIEVMGLAVLPGRLAAELAEVENILVNKMNFKSSTLTLDNPLLKHIDWIEYLIDKYPDSVIESQANQIIKDEVALKFEKVLEHCGVYKRDQQGKRGFCNFLNKIGFK